MDLVIPVEAHQPMREAIAPQLSMFNAAGDVTAFIVVALSEDTYEVRTDLSPRLAREWLLFLADQITEN
jgi:hypothetical protein